MIQNKRLALVVVTATPGTLVVEAAGASADRE